MIIKESELFQESLMGVAKVNPNSLLKDDELKRAEVFALDKLINSVGYGLLGKPVIIKLSNTSGSEYKYMKERNAVLKIIIKVNYPAEILAVLLGTLFEATSDFDYANLTTIILGILATKSIANSINSYKNSSKLSSNFCEGLNKYSKEFKYYSESNIAQNSFPSSGKEFYIKAFRRSKNKVNKGLFVKRK